MKAAIIDDLADCRGEIRDCLNRYLNENYAGETPVIEEFESGEEFLSRFTPEDYDIIFIDQYMNGLSGIGVRACGYLVKPLSYDKFEKTMELARLGKIRNARFIRIEGNKVLLREILWCGQDGHYVEITRKNGARSGSVSRSGNSPDSLRLTCNS